MVVQPEVWSLCSSNRLLRTWISLVFTNSDCFIYPEEPLSTSVLARVITHANKKVPEVLDNCRMENKPLSIITKGPKQRAVEHKTTPTIQFFANEYSKLPYIAVETAPGCLHYLMWRMVVSFNFDGIKTVDH